MPTDASDATETRAQPVRLMLDTGSERAHARLRLAAAVISLIAGVWLFWVGDQWWLRVTGLASVAFALRWISAYRTTTARGHQALAHYLEISADGVTLATGTNVQSVARNDVRAVELDDDRLLVVLRLNDGRELAIEPSYGGLGLRELGDTLQRALCAPNHRDAPD
jgi:hypothetical protein